MGTEKSLSQGESLRLRGRISQIGRSADGEFEKPVFFRPDQSLILSLQLADEFPDAYESRNISGLAQVKRNLDNGIDAALGVGLAYADVEQFGEDRNFFLISMPAAFNWDRRNDTLDPAGGGNLGIKAASGRILI